MKKKKTFENMTQPGMEGEYKQFSKNVYLDYTEAANAFLVLYSTMSATGQKV